MENEKELKHTKVYEQFMNARAFKNVMNLDTKIKRSVMFENGQQWRMDADLDDFPKITLNIIKQIGETRMSNIMQNEYGYLINSTNFNSIRKIQDFLKYLAGITKLKQKDLKALRDDFTKGTAIMYAYWDAEKRGFMRKSGGEMRWENIDIRNFCVADAYLQDIQDQEWVIVNHREKVGAIKEKYPHLSDKIFPNGLNYTSETEHNEAVREIDEEKLNVYKKFFRNSEGEVFVTISTEYVLLEDSKPLNPYYAGKDFKEMPNTTSNFDSKSELEKRKKDKRSQHTWNLYPFARLCLNESDNMFYGTPIAFEYIETQKSVNSHFSVYDKALQDNVLGGFVYRKGILDEEELVAGNGQMVALDIAPNEDVRGALNRIPVAEIPNGSHNYSQALVGIARQVAGASNIQMGMSDYAGQSGKQTQLLLERAKENSSTKAMLFNEFKREQAYIMFLFAKFYYDNESFSIVEHGYKQDNARAYTEEKAFNGTEYLEDDVVIDIKVGASPSFSEYSNIEMLGLMVQSGQAPFEAYIQLLPDGYISNKEELLTVAKNNSLKQIQALQQKIEQQAKIMEQMSKAYEQTNKDRENIDVVIQENARLKSQMAEVTANAIKIVSESKKEVTELTNEMQNILRIANTIKQ